MKKFFLLLSFFVACAVNAQVTNGTYYRIKSAATNKYLRAQNPATGVNYSICQYTLETYTGSFYLWQAIQISPGVYKFYNGKTRKYMAVSGGSADAGIPIILYADEGQEDIKWHLLPAGTSNQYKIKNHSSSLYVAIEGGGTTDGTNIVQWTDDGQADVKWIFEKIR
jgi:Ricin-type beta-trefoil lectin domain-like